MFDLGIPPFNVELPFYKYRSVESAIQILESNELYFPNAIQLGVNDPYELHHSYLDLDLSQELTDRYTERIFGIINKKPLYASKELFKEFNHSVIEDNKHRIGILSTATSPINSYCWQAYGDKNKGVCLGFKVPQNMYKELLDFGLAILVNYTDTPTPIKIIDENTAELTTNIYYWLCSKRTEFSREEEVRILDVNFCGAKKFPKQFLSEVVYGAETSEADKEKIENILIREQYNVKIGQCDYV